MALDDEIICLQELIKDRVSWPIRSHGFFEDHDTGKVGVVFNTQENELNLSDEDILEELEYMNKIACEIFRVNLDKFKIIDSFIIL